MNELTPEQRMTLLESAVQRVLLKLRGAVVELTVEQRLEVLERTVAQIAAELEQLN